MKKLFIVNIKYKQNFYDMEIEERLEFKRKISTILKKYDVEVINRYKIISDSNAVVNILSIQSIDNIDDIYNELVEIRYGSYIEAQWHLAVEAN